MLDRRSFLAATLGAATFPMPALARAALTLRVIAQRECAVKGQKDTFYPSLASTPGGKVAAMWGAVADHTMDAYVQILTPALAPRSKPIKVGFGMVYHAVGMSRSGGVALAGTAMGSTATPFSLDGALAGPEIQLTRPDSRVQIFEPAVCTLADGSFMTAWRAETRDSSYFGAAGLVIGPDGRRRTGLFNLFKRYQHYEEWVFIEALVPSGDGAVVVGTLDERGGARPGGTLKTPRSMRMRRIGRNGELGPVTEIVKGFDWAVGGAVGLRDRFALFWSVGGTLYGGLYAPNGVCVRDFEPVPDVRQPAMRVASNKMLAPISNGRLFNCAGSLVHDLSTGRLVARFDRDRERGSDATAVASLGHGRVAISSGETPAYLTTLAIE